jgi:hypothetical protein
MLQIDSCLVCELVRPEPSGKLSVLGFFGILPNVSIGLFRLDQPTILTFLFSGTFSAGTFALSFAVIDPENNRVIASTDSELTAAEGTVALPWGMVFTFGRPGTFIVQCTVDSVEQFRDSFRITQGTPESS